jgi:hypothetical protein
MTLACVGHTQNVGAGQPRQSAWVEKEAVCGKRVVDFAVSTPGPWWRVHGMWAVARTWIGQLTSPLRGKEEDTDFLIEDSPQVCRIRVCMCVCAS